MFDTVLLPTDGSAHADAALKDAIELAAEEDAHLHVLSVADSGPLGDVQLPGEAASPREVLHERAQRFVDEAVERAETADVRVTGVVRKGPPPSEILKYAREIKADVIVMGSRGRGGLHRMAVGSVADHVVRFGEFRVLVVDAGSLEE